MATIGRLTATMLDGEVRGLRKVRRALGASGVEDREQFQDMMAAAFRHGGLELRALADHFGFSFSTVLRWQEGVTAPHRSIWPQIVAWVVEQIDDGIDRRMAAFSGSVETTEA